MLAGGQELQNVLLLGVLVHAELDNGFVVEVDHGMSPLKIIGINRSALADWGLLGFLELRELFGLSSLFKVHVKRVFRKIFAPIIRVGLHDYLKWCLLNGWECNNSFCCYTRAYIILQFWIIRIIV